MNSPSKFLAYGALTYAALATVTGLILALPIATDRAEFREVTGGAGIVLLALGVLVGLGFRFAFALGAMSDWIGLAPDMRRARLMRRIVIGASAVSMACWLIAANTGIVQATSSIDAPVVRLALAAFLLILGVMYASIALWGATVWGANGR